MLRESIRCFGALLLGRNFRTAQCFDLWVQPRGLPEAAHLLWPSNSKLHPLKRQKEVKDLSAPRLREADSVLAAVAGSTRATMVFFNFGVAYTSPSSTCPQRRVMAIPCRCSSN